MQRIKFFQMRRIKFFPMRRIKFLLIASVALSQSAAAQGLLDQVPATIPGYDTGFGVPLMARAERRLRELGIDVDVANLRPAADIGIGYDSNVRGGANAQGSGFAASSASLGIMKDDRNVTVAGFLNVDDRRYFSAPAQSRTNWSATIGASADLGGGRLSLAASHLALHQDRGDLDSIASDRPIAFQVEHARASYAYRFNRLTLTPNAEFTIYRFAATTIGGVPAGQLYRDRQVARAGLAGRYELAPDSGIIFALGAANTRYQYPQSGQPSRNSTDGIALIGLDSGSFNSGAGDPHAQPWRYSVLAGVQTRHYAAGGTAARTAPVVDAQVHWQPTGLTGASLRVTRAIEDSAQINHANAVLTRARLVLEHEYARDLVFQISGGVQLAEYSAGGTGASYNAGARVLWVINDNLRASLSYDLTRWREGVQDSTPQDGLRLRNLVLASLRVSP